MNGVHTSVWPFPSTALDCTLALQHGNKHTLTDLHLTLVASCADERVCQQTWGSLTAKRPPPLAGLSPASAEQDLAAECSVGVILPSGSACLPPTILNHSLGPYGEVVYHLFLAFTLSLFIYITFLQIVSQSLIWLAPLHYNALALAMLNPVGTL